MNNQTIQAPTAYEITAWLVTSAVLLLTLIFHLLPALLAGLAVFELVHILVYYLHLSRLGDNRAKVIAIALLAILSIVGITSVILGVIAFFRSDIGNIPALLKQMAEIIEHSRNILPTWISSSLPADAASLQASWGHWLHEHVADLQLAGKEAGRAAVHILIGMVIGAMLSLRKVSTATQTRPLSSALLERALRVGSAFRRVIFAQVRIAAINAFLTGIYMVVILPAFGIHLPLTKTLIAITFITGLLPVIGNLVSNTVIVIVSLSHSLPIAAGSLIFLITIHKLEYFLNAHIIGTRISAHPWELLLAMLLCESAFGLTGLIAAPIYYAYIKDELTNRGLV